MLDQATDPRSNVTQIAARMADEITPLTIPPMPQIRREAIPSTGSVSTIGAKPRLGHYGIV